MANRQSEQGPSGGAGDAPNQEGRSAGAGDAPNPAQGRSAGEGAPNQAPGRMAGISDAAVQEKTGRSWSEWIATLDRAGCAAMDNAAIARHVAGRHGLPEWWSQMVAVGYEQAKGTRAAPEEAAGFSASVSRTFDVPVEVLFDAWHDDGRRRRWYGGDDFEITTATRPKSLQVRLRADDGEAAIRFTGRGAMKSQCSVEQERLATADDVPRMKRHWAEALDRLRENLSA